MLATDPVVTFVLILIIGVVAGVLFDRLAGPSWFARQFPRIDPRHRHQCARGVLPVRSSAIISLCCSRSAAGWLRRSLRRPPALLWCCSPGGWPGRAKHGLARFASGTGPPHLVRLSFPNIISARK